MAGECFETGRGGHCCLLDDLLAAPLGFATVGTEIETAGGGRPLEERLLEELWLGELWFGELWLGELCWLLGGCKMTTPLKPGRPVRSSAKKWHLEKLSEKEEKTTHHGGADR